MIEVQVLLASTKYAAAFVPLPDFKFNGRWDQSIVDWFIAGSTVSGFCIFREFQSKFED